MRKYSTSRFWKKPRVVRTSSRRHRGRKITDGKLYELVKRDIVELGEKYGDLPVTAEGFANKYEVAIHRITQVFRKLNQEGLLSQRMNHQTDHRWTASRYVVRSKGHQG